MFVLEHALLSLWESDTFLKVLRSLIACATCHKAITRAEPFISELAKVIVQHPVLDLAAAHLLRHMRVTFSHSDSKRVFYRTSLASRSAASSSPTIFWLVGAPFSLLGQLMLLKNPSENKFGILVLSQSRDSHSDGTRSA